MDVLIYDVWASGEELTEDLIKQYPGKAIVLTSRGMDVGWAGADVDTLSGSQTRGALAKAVEAAYTSHAHPGSTIGQGA